MPDAISIGVDQVPLAQRWKELPPTQFQVPSGLQDPLRAPLLELELLSEVLDGPASDTEDVAGEDATGEAPFAKTPGAPVAVVSATEIVTPTEVGVDDSVVALAAADEVAEETAVDVAPEVA